MQADETTGQTSPTDWPCLQGAKRHTPVEELTGRWTAELLGAGLRAEAIVAGIDAAAAHTAAPARLSSWELAALIAETLGA